MLVCIFFFVHNKFPPFGTVRWKTKRLVVVQINMYIEWMGEPFEKMMTNYFEDFKKLMK